MWVRQFSRDRGRDSIDETEAKQGEASAENQAEARPRQGIQSENHVNILN